DMEFKYNDKNISFEDLNYYIYNQNALGWSNIDKIIGNNNQVEFKVNLNASEDTNVKLVFKNVRSVVPAFIKNGKYVFEKIPGGMEATLIIIQYKNDKVYMAFQDITTSNDKIEVEFKEYSLEELKAKLKELDMLN
ncbi:MAG TPA: hypothetical protein PKE14_10055, partial [Chitinophagales bacterium]|nr:hypothetical protein [Chitinophagales bacterium]